MNEDSRIQRNMKIARYESAVKIGCSDWCGLPLNVLERTSEQALCCSPKGGRCNFWGMLHWLRWPEMILNVSMIAVVLTPSWLVWILTIMLAWLHFSWFLFCFWTRKFIHYTSVSCFWLLLLYVSLQSHWAWKLSKFGLSISFSLRGFSSLLTLL